MKNSARSGFTLVELLIGVVMMSVVIAGIAFTVSSGFDLYTTADSNAVVVSGVRFTADSFNRNVAPMLNVTDKIEILSTDLSSIPDHASISDDIHYIFLSNDSVVHRDSKGNHVLEGSGYIDHIEFTIPVPTSNDQNNYILKMDIKGQNPDQPNAKLDLVVESSLYNKPTKTGTATGPTGSKVYKGNILKIKASLKLDRLDLYDNDTKIKINKLSVHKGTDIEAIYDLINQLGSSQPMSDDSKIEWFISGSASADITVTEISPTPANKNSYYWQLVSGDTPVKGNVLNTTGTFHLKTGTTVTDWEVGVIRCRVTPAVKSLGGLTMAGIPKWSDYVVIKSVTSPSEEFQSILDFLASPSEATGDLSLTTVSTSAQQNKYVSNVQSGQINMTIDKHQLFDYGASFVMQLNYDRFDNDRIYGAWTAGRESASDIPSYITVTNYSVVIDSKLEDDEISSSLFLSTRSNNPNFGINTDRSFKDVGYALQYTPYHQVQGFFVSKFKDGKEILLNPKNKNKLTSLGVYNETLDNREGDSYNPEYIDNSNFTFGNKWIDRYRVLYTVLEYYDSIQGKAYPRYIFRVRFLKRTDNWDADSNHTAPVDKLAEIKKRDPWCIGPKFYASEPMWFGDFVGNPNTTPTTNTTTVKIKNYYYTSAQTATLNRKINIATKIFYALKNSSTSVIFRKRAMNARVDELDVDGTPIDTKKVDTSIPDGLGGTVLSNPEASRYVGIRGIVHDGSVKNDPILIYGLDLVPGFTINEIRSIMPNNGKLYSIEESIPSSELSKIVAKDWYKSYKNIIASSNNDINEKIFGTINKKSDGSGDNGSWYYQYAGSDGGIYDLQHVKSGCKCPLHNELFKWFGGE